MSSAAHDCVRACTHPQVKGPTLALFDAIAHFVPEGETTTPLIGMRKDLAVQARIDRRTVVTHLGILVELGEVKVIDGGQGRPARYHIVRLDGAQPITAMPLPLRADLQPVPPRARPALPKDTTGDLFAPAVESTVGEQPAINLCTPITSTPRHLWSPITSWVAYLWSTITSTVQLVIGGSVLVIDDHKLAPPLEVPIDPRARDVLPLKETTTTGPPSDAPRPRAVESPPFGSPRCRYFGTRHAWCGGRVHVPMPFHVEERRKLSRGPEETDADLDARLFACYARILAAVPDYEPILDRNEFEFWKRVLRSAAAPATTRAPSQVAPRRPDIPIARPCPHDPPCAEGDTDACVDRSMADWRRDHARSG